MPTAIRTVLSLALALAGSLALTSSALAQPEGGATLSEIRTLAVEAQSAFDNYSYKKAVSKLERALALATSAGLTKDPKLAEVHVLLGVAFISGHNDLYRGLHSFVQALRINPRAEIPKKLSTPQLMQMFNKARQTVKEIGVPPVIRVQQTTPEESADLSTKRGGPRGLVHTPLENARRGYPIPVKVEAGLDLQANRVYLYYRPAGRVAFTAIPMLKSGNLFRIAIPADATQGRYFHYYIEARDQRGRLAASFGSSRSPSVVTVQ
jgi:hypothetical protein